MEAGKVTLFPLTEKNYPTWKVQVKMYLMKEDLFRLVDGSESPPSSADAGAVRKYNLRRDKALATIVLAIDPQASLSYWRSYRSCRGVAEVARYLPEKDLGK